MNSCMHDQPCPNGLNYVGAAVHKVYITCRVLLYKCRTVHWSWLMSWDFEHTYVYVGASTLLAESECGLKLNIA